MGRSFGIVEQKVEESAYFLEQLEDSLNRGMAIDSEFLLSAFVSSTRSITFTIQASISDIEGFDAWYSGHQNRLKKNKLAKYFLEARNLSQKVGYYLIAGGQSYTDENGNSKMHYYFQKLNGAKKMEYVPEEDIIIGCISYFKLLLEVVLDCYKVFGRQIDPEQMFTIENLLESKLPMEYFEEKAGYPIGYTNVPGLTLQDRIDLIRRYHPKPSSTFDRILADYLNRDRFGESVYDE